MILVVLDDDDLSEFVRLVAERRGHEVSSTKVASEALALARKHQPEVVFLDIGLANVGGVTFCQELRRELDPAKSQIIATSSEDHPDLLSEAFNSGACRFLGQPFKVADLLGLFGERE